ncbi:DUF4328 domain-containing protein [Kitasatospora sp. NPDC056651]|uniref:DUF4328 domain-containing protein n=1 Tax=Kitasatospora sp. NPDC056651 TaxID=3345892 RepID=UPI0036D1001F
MSSPAVYRSPRSSSVAATVLLAVCGALSLAAVGAGFLVYGEAGKLAGGDELADSSALMDAIGLHDAIGLLQLVAMVASAVTFIVWFHRARVNAEFFEPQGHRFGRGWAIGSWFTPVVMLWFPWQIAVDTWQASARPDENGVRLPHPQPLLNLWWGAFVLSNLTGRFGARYASSAEYVDDYQEAVGWLIASDLAEVAAAVLAIVMVRRLSAMQEKRFIEPGVTNGTYGPYGPYGAHGATAWS